MRFLRKETQYVTLGEPRVGVCGGGEESTGLLQRCSPCWDPVVVWGFLAVETSPGTQELRKLVLLQPCRTACTATYRARPGHPHMWFQLFRELLIGKGLYMLQKCTFGKNFYFLPLTARVALNVPLTLLQNNSGLLSQKQKWIAGWQGALEESCYLSMIRYKRFYFVKVPPICLYRTFEVLSVCFQINPVSPHHLVLVQADGHPRTTPLLPAPSSSLPGRKGFFFPIQEVSEFFSSIAWL